MSGIIMWVVINFPILILVLNLTSTANGAVNNGIASEEVYSLNTVTSEVSCSRTQMTVNILLNDTLDPVIYLEKLKGYPICKPTISEGKATFHLPLDDSFYTCGTTKILNKITGTKVFYHRIIVEGSNSTIEPLLVKCVLPSETSFLHFRNKRQARRQYNGDVGEFIEPSDLPENFEEPEILDFTDNITASAPYPYLNIKVRQNGQFVDTALNVQPGTPLEMIIYLDERSREVYGLLTSYLKVTDNTPRRQEEVIILNGCSIDPYIFGNFETYDSGDSLAAKFRAFKFPESNFVMFVGTVNVCLKECKGVPCGNGQYGFGRKKRSIPAQFPPDINKLFEVEMTAILKVSSMEEQIWKKKKEYIERNYEEEDDDVGIYIKANQSKARKLSLVQEDENESERSGGGITGKLNLTQLIVVAQILLSFIVSHNV